MKKAIKLSISVFFVLFCAAAFGFSDGFDSIFSISPSSDTPQVNSVITVSWTVIPEEGGQLSCIASSTPTITGWNGLLSASEVQLTMPATPGPVTLQLSCADAQILTLHEGSVALNVVP
jgi:hypothetical protein